MASLYKKTIAGAELMDLHQAEQRAFIGKRNQCSTVECIVKRLPCEAQA